jgi:S-adenosylmethionine synthetase
MKNLITSESVCVGHPDKMCDIIADNILDAYLKKDSNSRCAIEVMATKDKVIVSGEVTSCGKVNIEKIVRDTICSIGYDNDLACYNGNTIKVELIMNTQSPDISMGVNKKDIGAGDQGMAYGYATNETPDYLPLSLVLSNTTMKIYDRLRKEGKLPGCRPDAKCQYTIEYEENYGNYMHPYDSWNKITSSIQFYAEAGGKLLYNLMAYDNMANSDWSRLHMYVEAMQEWNCNLNTNDLIEDFMNHYYKDAAPYMLDWFY